MAGLLDYITEAAKAQYAKGAPYRNALGGLLSGDMSGLQELNKPSPVMPNEALDVAMTFAPMGIVGGDITKILKSLKQQNPSTYPKIPVNKIFKNDVGNLESLDRMKADEGFLNNATTNQFVNINDIIPTQKNVTTKNIKDINNVSALPELIKVNDKYYVNDGHHRISRDILTGDDKIQAKVYEGLLSNNKTPLTEFEVKQLTAQRNAALPVAEGGLGLPANNTAMDRAKAMGFKGTEYHTTDAENIDNIYNQGFSNIHRGERNFTSLGDEYGGDRYYSTGVGNYTSDNPFASEFTSQGKLLANKAMLPLMINKSKHFDYTNPEHIKDLMTPRKTEGLGQGEMNPADLKALQEGKHNVMEDWMTTMNLKKRGYTGTNLKEPKQYYGGEGTTTNTFDPSLFRSQFAAFDPFRRNERDILAGIGVGLPVSSGLLDLENKKETKKEKKKTK